MIDVMIFIAALETEEERSMAARIFELYQNAMYWTAHDVLKNNADSEDALMKAVENICQHIHDFDGLSENDIKRKVKTIVQNAAIDIYRKKSKENTISIDAYWNEDLTAIDNSETKYEDIFFEKEFGSIQKHILNLKEKYKVVLLLKYVDMMSNKEIANYLYIPESTVATHIQRAKQFLKSEIEKGKKGDGNEQV